MLGRRAREVMEPGDPRVVSGHLMMVDPRTIQAYSSMVVFLGEHKIWFRGDPQLMKPPNAHLYSAKHGSS